MLIIARNKHDLSAQGASKRLYDEKEAIGQKINAMLNDF